MKTCYVCGCTCLDAYLVPTAKDVEITICDSCFASGPRVAAQVVLEEVDALLLTARMLLRRTEWYGPMENWEG